MSRKKKRSTRSGGRRRIGASSRGGITGEILPLVIATGGAIGARYIGKIIPNMNPTLQGGITMAAGVFLRMQKNPMLAQLGTGLFIGGGLQLAGSLGLITGISAVRRPLVLNQSNNGRQMMGYNSVRNIGASNPVNNFPNPMAVGRARRYSGAHE